MKKSFKKLLSMILAVIIIFSFTQMCFAEENTTNASQNTTENIPNDNGEGSLDAPQETPNDTKDDIVATLSLMSCIYFFPISGHTWLYVENLSDEPIQVGLYEVPVGEGVSIGSFAFTSRDGWGIYYNLEALREYRSNNYDSHYSVTKELTKAELEEVSNDIAGYVNYWDFYFNCAFFAFSIWNANTGDFLIPLVIPAISQLEVIIAGGKKGVMKMFVPTEEQVFRQKGSLDKAYLVPATDSINRK